MQKQRVFISYDYSNDRNYKDMLLAWDTQNEFDFDCNDSSAIKRVISARIDESTVFLCLVGKSTHQSSWVEWEINKAVELKKIIAAVRIDSDNPTPSCLYGVGAKWAQSFTFENLKRVLE